MVKREWEGKRIDIKMIHSAVSGEEQVSVVFSLKEESQGTQRMFQLAGPLFMETQTGGNTELFSLADFKPKPRKDKSLKNGYLTGAYGVSPVLGDFFSEE